MPKVREDLRDDLGRLDTGDDRKLAAAPSAAVDLDAEKADVRSAATCVAQSAAGAKSAINDLDVT
ncbi:MAG: hypothetical protein KDI32_14900 [Pseudomonadales bacterium]|nr:hypothetical protein [Pseudomonadales bacterium]